MLVWQQNRWIIKSKLGVGLVRAEISEGFPKTEKGVNLNKYIEKDLLDKRGFKTTKAMREWFCFHNNIKSWNLGRISMCVHYYLTDLFDYCMRVRYYLTEIFDYCFLSEINQHNIPFNLVNMVWKIIIPKLIYNLRIKDSILVYIH
jgi:hypothetical protein